MAKSELGVVLSSHGWITADQLRDGIERQRHFGGRIGTCLLETRALTEAQLLQALSEQLDLPTASRTDLARAPSEVVELLPAGVAIRCAAVPFQKSGSQIDVALLDAGDLALEDELSFSLGSRIRAHVASEAAIVEALHRHYGAPVPLRFRALLDLLGGNGARARAEGDEGASAAHTPIPASLRADAPERTERTLTKAPPKFERRTIPLTDAEREALEASRLSIQAPGGELAPPEPATSGTALEAEFAERLSRAETASQIGAFLTRTLVRHFERVLLYRVSSSRDEVSGWIGEGPGIDFEWLRHYSVGLHQATVFRHLAEGARLYAGRLDRTPAHEALARCWGGQLDHECLLLPIRVRQRLACVLLADKGKRGLSGVDLDLLQRLATKTSLAFERCILRRKMQIS